MRLKKIADIEALKQAKLIKDQVLTKQDDTLPAPIISNKGADIFYRNLQTQFAGYGINGTEFIKIVLELLEVVRQHSIVDWHLNREQIRIMKNAVDDYLYDVIEKDYEIKIGNDDRNKLEDLIIELAKNNFEVFN